MTQEEILQFKNLVKHEFVDCVAHDEGQYCCLDEEHQRHNQIIDFINNLLKSRQEKMIEEIKEMSLCYADDSIENEMDYITGQAHFKQHIIDMFNQGLDKGIEVINTCKEINKII